MLSMTLELPSLPTPGSGLWHSFPSPFVSSAGPRLGYVLVGISAKVPGHVPTFFSPAAAGIIPARTVEPASAIGERNTLHPVVRHAVPL